MSRLDTLAGDLRRQFEDLASRFMASDQGQRLIEWYEHRGERDRLALRVLAGFVALIVVYAMLLQPMLEYGNQAQSRLQEERTLQAWLRARESAAGQIARAAPADRNEPIATLVNNTAQENKLSIRRYQPVGDDAVRIWLEGANFNSVVKWLYQLEHTHGVRMTEMNAERQGDAGLVNVRVTLGG